MYCIKCECVPVSESHSQTLIIFNSVLKLLYPRGCAGCAFCGRKTAGTHTKLQDQFIVKMMTALATKQCIGINGRRQCCVVRAVRNFSLAFTQKCGWHGHAKETTKTCETSAASSHTQTPSIRLLSIIFIARLRVYLVLFSALHRE